MKYLLTTMIVVGLVMSSASPSVAKIQRISPWQPHDLDIRHEPPRIFSPATVRIIRFDPWGPFGGEVIEVTPQQIDGQWVVPTEDETILDPLPKIDVREGLPFFDKLQKNR